MIALDDRVAAAAVHEEDDGPCAVEHGLVLRPTPGDEHRVDARDLLEGLDEQLAPGVELVVARAVAGTAGDDDDLGILGPRGNGQAGDEGEGGEGDSHGKFPLESGTS